MNTRNAVPSAGEIGDTVIYVCDGQHNASALLCEAGDAHPAIVADVQSRDSEGKPSTVLLALLIPQQSALFWRVTPRAFRSPGSGDMVTRVHRGAPPAETCMPITQENDASTPVFSGHIDFPLRTWHAQHE